MEYILYCNMPLCDNRKYILTHGFVYCIFVWIQYMECNNYIMHEAYFYKFMKFFRIHNVTTYSYAIYNFYYFQLL